MPTIRIQDWTKEELEAVREMESHSSYDSVVKALLRDRKLVQALDRTETLPDTGATAAAEPDKRFENLSALAEVTSTEKGIMFLWCPNCGNEIAHITAENRIDMSVFEVQCQQCLSELNHHAVVTVEIGYPVEEKTVQNELQNDLRACVIDYWDRMLATIGDGTIDADVDTEYLIWQIYRYYRVFDWEWPTDVPTVGLKSGRTYHNQNTDECLEVIETNHHNEFGTTRVRVWPTDGDPEAAVEQQLGADEFTHLLCSRTLYHTTE